MRKNEMDNEDLNLNLGPLGDLMKKGGVEK